MALGHLHAAGYFAASPATRNSWLCVDFFFVLSGFVIASSYGRRLADGFPIRDFMLLRLGRVWPLHVAVLTVLLAAWLVQGHAFVGSHTTSALVATLFLVQIFRTPRVSDWNQPSWSIDAEVWTYLLAAIGLRLAGRRMLWWVAAVAIVSALLLMRAGGAPGYAGAGVSLLARCLYGFSLGMLTYRAHERFGRRYRTAAEFGALGLALLAGLTLARGPAAILCQPCFALLILVLARGEGQVSRLLGRRPFVWLGLLSYSIYMTHMTVIEALRGLARSFGSNTPWLGVAGLTERAVPGHWLTGDFAGMAVLAMVVGISAITYRWIERPMRYVSRAFVHRRTSLAAERIAPTF